MDMLQDHFPQIFNLYSQYYHPYAAYLRPLRRALYLSQSYFYRYLFPTLYPFYVLSHRLVASLLTETPSLATLALLAVVLVLSLKLLDMLRRTIIYWISVALQLTMWAAVALLGLYVYQRGVEQSLEDLGWLIGIVAGLGERGQNIGQAKAAGRERNAQKMYRGNPRGRTRGAGW
ncbi:MAG: hypothetical protein Q9190_002146 [Brigantiaea leucoxantha]